VTVPSPGAFGRPATRGPRARCRPIPRSACHVRSGLPPPSLTTLLARLAASGTEFLLVGGEAAVAQGAPIATIDVDVVHRREPANVDRLLAFLAEVDARYRARPAGQVLRPTREALLGDGHHLLATALGPLDLLGAVERGRGYESLLPDALEVDVEGQRVRVVRLEALADLKRGSTSPKDRLVLAVLEDVIRRRR
jgi:hypothetical protein